MKIQTNLKGAGIYAMSSNITEINSLYQGFIKTNFLFFESFI